LTTVISINGLKKNLDRASKIFWHFKIKF